MGMECGECEQDLRGGHAETCSRYRAPEPCAHCGSTRGEDVAGFCLSCDQLAPTMEETAGSATTAWSAAMMKMPDELMNLRRPPYCWCIGFAIVGRAQRLFGPLVKRPKLFRFEV